MELDPHDQYLMGMISSHWGASLVQISEPLLSELSLDAPSKHYLQTVGLPDETAVFCFSREIMSVSDGFQFGTAWDGPLVIASDSGVILSHSPVLEGSRYANANLPRFFACLIAFNSYCERIGSLEGDEDSILKLIAESRRDIAKADHTALADEEHFWSLILEQMEDGLL